MFSKEGDGILDSIYRIGELGASIGRWQTGGPLPVTILTRLEDSSQSPSSPDWREYIVERTGGLGASCAAPGARLGDHP